MAPARSAQFIKPRNTSKSQAASSITRTSAYKKLSKPNHTSGQRYTHSMGSGKMNKGRARPRPTLNAPISTTKGVTFKIPPKTQINVTNNTNMSQTIQVSGTKSMKTKPMMKRPQLVQQRVSVK